MESLPEVNVSKLSFLGLIMKSSAKGSDVEGLVPSTMFIDRSLVRHSHEDSDIINDFMNRWIHNMLAFLVKWGKGQVGRHWLAFEECSLGLFLYVSLFLATVT